MDATKKNFKKTFNDWRFRSYNVLQTRLFWLYFLYLYFNFQGNFRTIHRTLQQMVTVSQALLWVAQPHLINCASTGKPSAVRCVRTEVHRLNSVTGDVYQHLWLCMDLSSLLITNLLLVSGLWSLFNVLQ